MNKWVLSRFLTVLKDVAYILVLSVEGNVPVPYDARILLIAYTYGSNIRIRGRDIQFVNFQFQQLRVDEPQASVRRDGEVFPSSSSAVEPSASATGPSVHRPSITQSSASVDRSHPDFTQLQSESVRLSTFHDWPESAGRIVDPRDLAATGLFYTAHADRVQCAFCRGCLRNWQPGDSPANEHRRHVPDCPLMRGAVTGNVPTNSATRAVRSASLYCQYSDGQSVTIQ